MLTKVMLEGVMGAQFGREWELEVDSVSQAISLIDANCEGGLRKWMSDNLDRYGEYEVVVTRENGYTEHALESDLSICGKYQAIHIVPMITGSGKYGQIILGAAMIAAGVFVTGMTAGWATPVGNAMIGTGIGMVLGGVVQLLTPQPRMQKSDDQQRKDGTSYYFDGPQNTSMQGLPVQVVYGRVLVGSQAVSAKMSIEQLIITE